MNREIKYRGKRFDSGEWVYGYFVEDGFINICSHNEDDFLQYNVVNPDTIGQYTGLHDCNGKEVYEGDLLKDDEITWEVFWCDDVAAFMVEQYKSECDAPKMFLLSDVAKDSVIIGTIHDKIED